MKKRVLSILLALVMVLSILPVSGVFAEEEYTYNYLFGKDGCYYGKMCDNIAYACKEGSKTIEFLKLDVETHEYDGLDLTKHLVVSYATADVEHPGSDAEVIQALKDATFTPFVDGTFKLGYLKGTISEDTHLYQYGKTQKDLDPADTVAVGDYSVKLYLGTKYNYGTYDFDVWANPSVTKVSLANLANIEENDRFKVYYTDFFYLGEKDVVENFEIKITDTVLDPVYELKGEESFTPEADTLEEKIVDYEYKVVGAKKADAKEDDFILDQYEEFDAEENYTPEEPAHCVIFTGNNTNGNYTDYAVLDIVVDDPYVFFESNGGSEVEPQAVVYGETAVKPVDPTKDGYTFAGWYTDEELTQAYDFATPVTENTILYAKWENNPKTGIAGSYTTLIIAGGLLVLAAAAVVVLRKRSTQK